MTKIETIKLLFSLLKPVQKTMFKQFVASTTRTGVFHCSRRIGKTHLLCTMSVIFALKKSQSNIRYASVTQKAVRKMVHPIFKDLFSKIPKKYQGKWNSQEGAYKFQNGSQIHLAGCNNQRSDDLRGTSADLALVDEAAFVDDLSYLVDSVLMPQLLTVQDSKLIMASSSPLSPAHEFVDYINASKVIGSYHSYTIHDGGYSKELIEEFCEEAGGETSTTWRREYLNEILIDDDWAIIPEHKGLKLGITHSIFRDKFQNYVGMDLGVKDLTVALFGYYDFPRATLCIQRELVINGPQMTTPILANGIKKIEEQLFSKEPRRISDNNNLLLLQDLGYLHNCHFIPTSKDSLEAMVNEMRIWISSGRVEIDQSCQTLIQSIKLGYWNDLRTGWGRAETLGHFDALAALMYLIRNVDVTSNPIPKNLTFDEIMVEEHNSNHHELTKLFI